MSAISNDLFMKSLSFLPLEDIASCPLVSKRWHAICSDEPLWKLIAANLQMPLSSRAEARKTLQPFIHYQALRDQEILQKIEHFLQRISLGHNGKFICFFNAGKKEEEKLEIVIKGNQRNLPGISALSKFAIVERYFSTKAYEAHLPDPPSSRLSYLLNNQIPLDIPIQEEIISEENGPYKAIARISGFRCDLPSIATLLGKKLSDFSEMAQDREWRQATEAVCTFAILYISTQLLSPLNRR